MASSDAFLAHVVSRIQADIHFLVEQGIISPEDGQHMSSKLPPSRQTPMLPTPTMSSSSTPTSIPAPVAPPVKRGVPLPPSRSVSDAPQARSLWPYNENGQEVGDLSFGAGETIEILEETNADWWKGKNSRGETGLFPSNYVEKVVAPIAPPAFSGRRMVAPLPNEKTSYNPVPVGPPEPEPQQQQQDQPPKKNKFGKLGNTMAQSAAGGVGFGAGAAIGSGIIHSIF